MRSARWRRKLGLSRQLWVCRIAEELDQAAAQIGYPVVVKPVMSSSGKGQSVVENRAICARLGLRFRWKTRRSAARDRRRVYSFSIGDHFAHGPTTQGTHAVCSTYRPSSRTRGLPRVLDARPNLAIRTQDRTKDGSESHGAARWRGNFWGRSFLSQKMK